MSASKLPESIADFSSRATEWISANLPSTDDPPQNPIELQRCLFDNGFAGIAFPAEYGGAGLTLEHQKVFYDLAREMGRQVPTGTGLMVSVGMLGPTLLEHGSHEAKAKFLPRLLRGDDLWIQLLSEPRGGSDMAGARTRLTRDGDSYVLSGSKMWSTGAHVSHYGLCLARTDWEAPKHRGLSMIAVPLDTGTEGLVVQQTRTADGTLGEFCEEFFDDVALPAENLIGEENTGWSVAQTLLFHERNAAANVGFGYTGWEQSSSRRAGYEPGRLEDLIRTARARGTDGDSSVRQLIADVHIDNTVVPLTSDRIMLGMSLGTHQGQWGSLLKLQYSEGAVERVRAALAVSGAEGVIWDDDEVELDNPGTSWLLIRGGTLAGGSSEMQRNIISERLLGLPREPSVERGIPFNEVIRNQKSPE
ncbi:MAG: acyl-CoA dehydrogenase family protein [bacterium]|nr:acyl-CoA dehydrogenase family protein [bacterium]